MKMTFIPFESVGIFNFGDEIEKYSDVLSRYCYTPPNEDGDEYYHIAEPYTDDDEHFIRVYDGKIRAIFCYKELIFNNTNLIGLTIEELKKATNADYVGDIEEVDIFDDEPPKYIYYFDDIGAQVWTHYGYVTDIIVAGYWSYSDD